jgi:hypothetical protein
MRGEIRTFAFDDRNSKYDSPKATADPSVREVSRTLYAIHDDLIDHPISASPECWAALCRIVAFLGTDLAIDAATDERTWPFRDERLWSAHESLVSECELPEYNPHVHGRPINHWSRRIPTRVGIAVIICGLTVVTALIMLLF